MNVILEKLSNLIPIYRSVTIFTHGHDLVAFETSHEINILDQERFAKSRSKTVEGSLVEVSTHFVKGFGIFWFGGVWMFSTNDVVDIKEHPYAMA